LKHLSACLTCGNSAVFVDIDQTSQQSPGRFVKTCLLLHFDREQANLLTTNHPQHGKQLSDVASLRKDPRVTAVLQRAGEYTNLHRFLNENSIQCM
jgi:hypothetical protein